MGNSIGLTTDTLAITTYFMADRTRDGKIFHSPHLYRVRGWLHVMAVTKRRFSAVAGISILSALFLLLTYTRIRTP